MRTSKVVISSRAKGDIQEVISWYNVKQPDLGKRFHKLIKQAISIISLNPHFAIKYDDVRCLKVKKFPYLIHYIIDGEVVYILAVICTHRNPEEHWPKNS